MAVIAPSFAAEKKKKLATSKNYLTQCATSKLRETVCTPEGRQMSVGQAIIERMTGIALFSESEKDSIAAAKFLWDRTEGKVGVVKDNTVKSIPKVTICLNEKGLQTIEDRAQEELEEEIEDDGEGLVYAEIDGKTYVG